MTTNEEILAIADTLAELIRTKMTEELNTLNLGHYPEAWNETMDDMANIARTEIGRYADLDIAPVGQMLTSLGYIVGGNFRNPLTDPAIGFLNQVDDYIIDWYGTAAEAFRQNFLSPFGEIRHNQVALVGELYLVLQGYETLITESRAKIVEIANQTIAALNALPAGGGIPLNIALTVAAAVVGVIAAYIGGGPALGTMVSLAILGGGLSIGAEIADEYDLPGEVSIQGGNVRDVVGSMYEAISFLRRDRINAENKLIAILEHDANLYAEAEALAANRQVNYFIPFEPTITDALAPTATPAPG